VSKEVFDELYRRIRESLDKCVDEILVTCEEEPLDGDSTEYIAEEFLSKLDEAMGNT
jgi:hypothetical protein